MNVSDQIISVINALCEQFGVAIDWTQANVVPYLQDLMAKYIKFEIASSALLIVCLIISTAICALVVRKLHRRALEVKYDEFYLRSAVAIIAWIFLVGLIIATVIVTVCQMYDIITCLTFPEKVIYDYITSLIGG